jgi:NADH dehydrogenase
MTETVLVLGATGQIGRAVVHRLAADGWNVRVLSRSPESARRALGAAVEVREGNILVGAAVRAAAAGCACVHVNVCGGSDPTVEPTAVSLAAEAARAAGARRLSYVSDTNACPHNEWHPRLRVKLQAESTVKRSGVPYTLFRPTLLLEMIEPLLAAQRAIVLARRGGFRHWLAVDDLAAVVSRALRSAEGADRAFDLWGPETHRLEELLIACRRASPTVGPVLRLPAPFSHLVSATLAPPAVRATLEQLRHADEVREGGDPSNTDAHFGIPPTTVEAWCRQHCPPP